MIISFHKEGHLFVPYPLIKKNNRGGNSNKLLTDNLDLTVAAYKQISYSYAERSGHNSSTRWARLIEVLH